MAVTPNYSWPVPVNTDYVKDGAEAIKDLGDAIDATVFGLPAPASGLTLIKTQVIGTAVTSVEVTDAFSATYDAYKFQVSGGVGNTSTDLQLRFGSVVTGYAFSVTFSDYNSTPGAEGNANGTRFEHIGTTGSGGNFMSIEVQDPFLNLNTHVQGSFARVSSSAGSTSGALFTTTSYTGFTILPRSGTLTGGTIRVYGYQK